MIDEIDSLTYTLKGAKVVKDPESGILGIKCLDCNLTSYNLNDISEGYCANCGSYHNPEQIKLDTSVSDHDIEQIQGIVACYLTSCLETDI